MTRSTSSAVPSRSFALPRTPAWQGQAMCRESDPELWFPFTRDADAVARSICRMCPVRQVCREYALEQRIPYGVWGGLGEKERRVLLAEADRDDPTAGQPP